MGEQPTGRFQIQVDEGPPHGDLYEWLQTTTYRVVDTHTGLVVLCLEGTLTAHLSPDTGLWDEIQITGARRVRLSADSRSVIVDQSDGEEILPLPE
jgi:hypothetical protein